MATVVRQVPDGEEIVVVDDEHLESDLFPDPTTRQRSERQTAP